MPPVRKNSDSGGGAWGDISGDIDNQADLQSALDAKVDVDGSKVLSDNNFTDAEQTKVSNAFDKTVDDTDDLTEGASNKFLSTAVQNQISNLEYQSLNQFVSVWKTDNSGTSTSTQISLPLVSGGTYDFLVEWGDGTVDHITAYNQAEVTHTYSSAGTYTVTITGTLTGFSFAFGNDRLKLLEIKNFGGIDLGNTSGQFAGATNLDITATDELGISSLTSLSSTFEDCTSLVSAPKMDTSAITNFSYAFSSCSALKNVPLYDTSSGTNFAHLFKYNYALTEIPKLNLSSATNVTSFLLGVTLTTESYSNFLIYLDTLTLQNGVSFNGGSSKYNTAGGTARSNIITNYSWSFSDGGAA